MASALVAEADRAAHDACTECAQACEAYAQSCIGDEMTAGCAWLCLDWLCQSGCGPTAHFDLALPCVQELAGVHVPPRPSPPGWAGC